MKKRSILFCFLLVLITFCSAHAVPVFNQPVDPAGFSRMSQEFPNFPLLTVFQFDDFTLREDSYLDVLTVYGEERGRPGSNDHVVAEVWDGLPLDGSIVLSASGFEDNENLIFDFEGALLPAGDYWLTAYVVRDTSGGRWYWREASTDKGSEAYFWNPGGGYSPGDTPVSGYDTPYFYPRDLAFDCEGSPVPEPATLFLVGSSLLGLAGFRKSLRKR